MPAPKDQIKREVWLNNLSRAHKGKVAWNKGREMSPTFKLEMGVLSKKFWNDPTNEEKIKIRNKKIADSKLGDKNPMKRPEVRKKASLSMKGRLIGDLNPSRKEGVRKKISNSLRGHTFSPDTREKIRKTLTGRFIGELNPFYGRTHSIENREKARIRAINMISSGLLSSRRTTIELEMKKALEKTNIKFKEQIPLKGITVVDFYLPEYKMVIYCDGDYWHKGEWAKKHKVINKDKWQTKILENDGYKVFRFSESKINNSADRCIDLIKNHIRFYD